jgi:hypothetical protein
MNLTGTDSGGLMLLLGRRRRIRRAATAPAAERAMATQQRIGIDERI